MKDNLNFKIILGFAAIYIIWGSTYLAIRLGVETIPPFLMAGVRFLIGGSLFYVYCIYKKAVKPTRKQWLSTAIVGTLLLVGGNGLVSWGEEFVPSGLAALLIATVPIWIVIFNAFHSRGSRPKFTVVVGIILGFLGVIALINPTNIGGFAEIDHFGALLIILASMFWALGSVYSKYADMPKSMIIAGGMQMIIAGVLLIILSMLTGELQDFELANVTSISLLSLGYLITFGCVGYGSYIWLLQVTEPSNVATYAYVNPVIALFLGHLLASETISLWTIGCSTLILVSVIIIISFNRKSQKQLKINNPIPPPVNTILK